MKMGLPAKKTDRSYTYGDYRGWPDDERWELIEGVAWNMSPAPSTAHQAISMEIAFKIRTFIEGRGCRVFAAPFDVLLPDEPGQPEDDISTVVQPDVSVICDAAKLRRYGCLGAPEWVSEIVSPYTSRKDMREKLSLYERHGMHEYWLIDPGNQYVHVYRLGEDGRYPDPVVYVDKALVPSGVLPGLVIDLGDLFASVPAV
jgi:Uma2 family endonuclease